MSTVQGLGPYPTCKPFDAEWLGDVSTHWEVWRLQNIVNPDSVNAGYEISFMRYFYKPQPLRAPHEIWADIRTLEREAGGMLAEIMGGA